MTNRPVSRPSIAGFSLIELLVSMVIGLVVTLAITSVLIRSEGNKRSTTSVNDINQTGAYAAYVLDRAIRSAGSGFAQNWASTYGCEIKVSQSTAEVPLPLAAIGASSAFAGVGTGASALPMRLAPVVIAKDAAGGGGDVLLVMAGAAGGGESGVSANSSLPPGTNSIPMQNAIGFLNDDLVLLAEADRPSGCVVNKVVSRPQRNVSDTVLSIANPLVSAFGGSTVVVPLGNAGATTLNMPQFQLFGVGANNTLFSYDLMKTGAAGDPAEVPIADGVVEVRGLYGISTATTPGKTVDAWVEASGTDPSSGYAAAALTDGTAAARTKLRRIVAVRIGLILRTALAERPQDYQQPTGTTINLFNDAVDAGGASLTQTRLLTGSELNYRFRTVEVTIPVRNTLLAP